MNKSETTEHVPVLLGECIESLNINPKGIYIDGTLGGAGHTEEIAKHLSQQGMLIGCDVDHDAIMRAQQRLKPYTCNIKLIHNNFRNLEAILHQIEIKKVDGILLDLGWSSFQIADPERGLSFQNDGPLDMNLSKGMEGDRITAYEMINHWEESTLADIFFAYGDEPKARIIARHIIQVRQERPIATTKELAQVVIEALFPKKVASKKDLYFKIHPATKVFQALRIAVNDELEVVTETVHAGIKELATGGRFSIITFHSGEDRIVKHLFKSYADQGIIKLVTKKPITPSDEELKANPRARSSKLRVAEKL